MSPPAQTITLHATAITAFDRGLLIRGASGSGKSSLALALVALGAALVSDDQVIATRAGQEITLTAPNALFGLIEARGIGLLGIDAVTQAPLFAILDLDHVEEHRLPPRRTDIVLGLERPLLHKAASPYFPAALMQYLRGGRKD